MSKLFEAIKKARRQGDGAPTVVETTLEESPGSGAGAVAARATAKAADAGDTSAEMTTVVPMPARSSHDATRSRRDRPVPVPDRHASPEEHMVSLTNPHSFEAEQFRALRHLVEERQRAEGLRALAVTSPTEGDGKSLVAVNLAGALAQSREARVLLVDADLRAPALNRSLGLRGMPAGLAEAVMSTTLDLDDIAIERSAFNLTVLTAGKPPVSPYEILKSDRFASLLAEARGQFDFIIVDTPPVLAFPDTRIIEGLVDSLLLVVGAHRTPRKMVDEAVESIAESKLLGLVFNGEDEPERYGAAYYGQPRRRFWGGRRR